MESVFNEVFGDEPPPPASSGMSQDELISRFAALDKLVKSASGERKDIGLQLAGLAWEEKLDQNTVHLTSTDGQRVKVVFGDETVYDVEMLRDVHNLLGTERFDELFTTEIKFTPKKRNLKMFLNTVASDEQVKTAKQIIQDATMVKPNTPWVSVE
jgi:hypothetical protein